MKQSALVAKNVSKTFIQAGKKLQVLKDISLSFEKGTTYAITGASGSGKSTLLHILGGLDTPTAGSAFLNKSKVGFVFQFHYLINELTALENVALMGLIAGKPKQKCYEICALYRYDYGASKID